MRQFDVFPNPTARSRSFAPFVVVIQSHHLSLDTVLVAPLVNDKVASNIEVGVGVQGQSYVVAITEMGSVFTASLRGAVGDLLDHEDNIRRGIERLLSGF